MEISIVSFRKTNSQHIVPSVAKSHHNVLAQEVIPSQHFVGINSTVRSSVIAVVLLVQEVVDVVILVAWEDAMKIIQENVKLVRTLSSAKEIMLNVEKVVRMTVMR